MTAQMKNFIDQTGALWAQGRLVGKVGSVFASSATQHGGQESTILTFHPVLMHLGIWLKMRIEEINSAMTHGKSEAWCAGIAIVYATKRTSCQNPPDCIAGVPTRHGKGPRKAQGLAVVSSSDRVFQ
jgi:multimeric flavodoxin WrbA